MKRHSVLPILLALTASLLQGNQWPQWRGPQRDGVAVGARLPRKWPTKWPAPAWSRFVGEGYSSPVIAGNRVFIQGRPAEGRESCLCFDAGSGKLLWKREYPCSFVPPDANAGRGPNSTPTVDGDRVYMLGLEGMFHCLEIRTGRVLWKRDFAKEFWGVEQDAAGDDAWFPACGMAASALVVGANVIVPVGGAKAGAFAAFHRQTGALVWAALPERSSYGSPIRATLAGADQLVGFTGQRMVGLDLASRELLWEYPFPAMYEQTILTPVLWRDRVIIGGEARPTVALQITRQDDRVLSREVWRSSALNAYLVTPVVMKDHLIGLDDRSRRLVCLDLLSGKRAWESPRIGRYVSLVSAGEQILALDEHGRLLIVAATAREYRPRGSWMVSRAAGTFFTQLAVAASRLYVKDRTHLHCFDLAPYAAAGGPG
jgi:outer membrane protein assembly factor BamB